MKEIGNRMHPRVYDKKCKEETETVVNMDVSIALGVLATIFVNGIVLGYCIRKRIH